MSTLAEIEQAIAALPAPEQRALYRHLGARLKCEPGADKRKAVERFLQRWTGAGTEVAEEEWRAQRAARLVEKHVK
jgi:hypothetical protein